MESVTRVHDEVTTTTSPSHCSGGTVALPGSYGSPAEPTPPPAPAVLLVGKCVQRETGNATTLARLGRAVRDSGWEAVIRDPDNIPHTEALRALVKQYNIVTALGLHAYRSANILLFCQELGIPYVTVFGGTDVNEGVRDAEKREVMGRVVSGAKSLVAFQDSMRHTVLQVWPSLPPDKIWIMPQAVAVDPDPDFDVLAYLEAVEAAHVDDGTHTIDRETSTFSQRMNQEAENVIPSAGNYERMASAGDNSVIENVRPKENAPPPEDIGVTASNGNLNTLTDGIPRKPQEGRFSGTLEMPTIFQPLVLLVAGLRPVKDVLYLTEAWSRWQRARGGRGRFLILGPAIDPQYAAQVLAQVDRLSGVRVCPTLSPGECQAVMMSATVLVNSSRSEGMASSIVEAMALGTPVIARDIEGNAALITHRHTGLLYSCPDTFIQELDCLLQDAGLRDLLITAAKDHVARCHSPQKEKDLLLRILEQTVQ